VGVRSFPWRGWSTRMSGGGQVLTYEQLLIYSYI
jgi:hypothetical protein